jgi:malate permease and related proteins
MPQLASAIGSVIVLILAGVVIRRVGLLGPEHVDILNQLIVYVALPALVFLGVYQQGLSLELFAISAVGLVTIGAGFGLAYLVGRALRLSGPTLGAFLLVAALGNTGYLGYPLTIALFGQARLVHAFFYDLFATTIGLFTIGIAVAAHYGRAGEEPPEQAQGAPDEAGRGRTREGPTREGPGADGGRPRTWQQQFRASIGLVAPVIVAVIAGLALKLVGLPQFLVAAVGHLGDLTVPLVMITIGMSIEVHGFKDFPAPLAATVALKLLVAPVIAGGLWLALQNTGLFGVTHAAGASPVSGPVTLSIVVLMASMPSMMLSYVVGSRYRLECAFIASAIVLTTMSSLLTVPLWQIALAAIK